MSVMVTQSTAATTPAQIEIEKHRKPKGSPDGGQFGAHDRLTPDTAPLPVTDDTVTQWTGQEGVIIASGTNPWVEADGKPVDLFAAAAATFGAALGDPDCECATVAGVALAMDSADGIQRCDLCYRFEGDLEAAKHVADLLTERTGREHTVWFEAETTPEASAPFVYNKNFYDLEQVRPLMADFLRVYGELEQPGSGWVYNEDFKGKIPGLQGASEADERDVIIMLQNLRKLDVVREQVDAFRDAGGREVTIDDIPDGQELHGTVVLQRLRQQDPTYAVFENARLRRCRRTGGLEYVEEGELTGHPIFTGDVMICETPGT